MYGCAPYNSTTPHHTYLHSAMPCPTIPQANRVGCPYPSPAPPHFALPGRLRFACSPFLRTASISATLPRTTHVTNLRTVARFQPRTLRAFTASAAPATTLLTGSTARRCDIALLPPQRTQLLDAFTVLDHTYTHRARARTTACTPLRWLVTARTSLLPRAAPLPPPPYHTPHRPPHCACVVWSLCGSICRCLALMYRLRAHVLYSHSG